ncbi:MAG: glycosyltransferase family 8 protein [Bacilli bacterium]|nr:glycosyltransferase family 8 protein [Bacilli bacterium]
MKDLQLKKRIPIFFSVDDNYIPFLAVSLQSLIKHANKNNIYLIKVLHANSISDENQNKIINKYSNETFDIEFVNIEKYVEKISNRLHTRDYYSKSTYYRLFIPNLYPEFNKAIYLDSDITILKDISRLYNIPLGNNLVGAIPDESVQLIDEFKEYVENRVGVDSYKNYFNAGILVMNLKKLREINFEDMFINLVSAVKFDVAQDQDYLNAICRNRVKYISNSWNKMPFPNYKIKEAFINLIHYNLDKKPWQQDGILYEKYFWECAKETEYYEKILAFKANVTVEQVEKSKAQTIALIKKTHEQAIDAEENARIRDIIDDICGFDKENDLLLLASNYNSRLA